MKAVQRSASGNPRMTTKQTLDTSRRLMMNGELTQAKALCQKLLVDKPNNVEALFQLGSIHLLEKQYEESSRQYKRVLMLDPGHIDANNNLGAIYLEYYKDYNAAEDCFRKVIAINPRYVNGLMNLGNVNLARCRLDDAEAFFRKALEVDPNNGAVLNNLGSLCVRRDGRRESVPYYRKALESLPQDTEVLANLITSEWVAGFRNEALQRVAKCLELPDPAHTLFPLFNITRLACLWDSASEILPRALEAIQNGRANQGAFENINLPLLATPEVSSEALFDIHKAAGRVIESILEHKPYERHEAAMRDAGRWRVGYLSPDFRHHAVSTFFRSLINSCDRERFEVHCYHASKIEDDLTDQYRASADGFVNVSMMSDAQIAERIHNDGIHFLVDLAGYTTNGRTSVLSYRPAPVQIMYLGYPYTSGLSAVDYFVSDPYVDGPNNSRYFTEQQLRLPESYCAFGELSEQVIDPVIPCERNGIVTFGSLNNTYKMTPDVIRVWSQVLSRVANSRLIINHPSSSGLEATLTALWSEFSKHGIGKERVEIIWARHPDGSHLRYYNDIDIVLDTFPLSGGTTTIDAVWMGVPVVTLVGEVYFQRISYTLLKNVGIDLEDLIAFTEAEYVEKAVALAANPARIIELRRSIPESLKTSILCDPLRLTRHMESAYLEGWDRKFPQRPVQFKMEDSAAYVAIRGGAEIAVDGAIDDMETYILKEQQGWFDPEYDFVCAIIQPGMRVLEIGAGIGVFAIPLAKQLGTGKFWVTTTTPREARLLQWSKARNRLDNLEVMIGADRKLLLDVEMARRGLVDIDFVRLNTNASDMVLADGGKDFFAKNSPLVMFAIKRDNSVVDTSLAATFHALGYETYRYIPGLQLLVPFNSDDDLDALAMNLFCCKVDQAERLVQRGLLIRQPIVIAELPGIAVTDWQDYLRTQAFATDLLDNWINAPMVHEGWEAYRVALNAYARSRDSQRSAEDRHAWLQASYGMLLLLVNARPSLPRLLTFCRVLMDLGKREVAVTILNQIFSLFDSGGDLSVDEPFVALSDHYAAVNPSEELPEWLFAAVLEQRELLRAFSSYFTGQESLYTLEMIQGTGFQSQVVDKRIELLRERYQISE